MNKELEEKEIRKIKTTNKILFSIGMAIIIPLFIICFGIFVLFTSPILGGYCIVEINNTTKLSDEEYKQILDIMNKDDQVEITKIAYEKPFRHESSCYIYYKTKNSNEEYIFEDIIFNTNTDENYKTIKKICDKHYKWWKFSGTSLNIDYSKVTNI